MEGRQNITPEEIGQGLEDLRSKLARRLNKKGSHCWKSRHEILGVVAEEYHEVIFAVTEKTHGNASLQAELLDLAVAAILGYINVKNGKTDW